VIHRVLGEVAERLLEQVAVEDPDQLGRAVDLERDVVRGPDLLRDRVEALLAALELHRAGSRAHERGRVAHRLLA
jgi:hypothetical protein